MSVLNTLKELESLGDERVLNIWHDIRTEANSEILHQKLHQLLNSKEQILKHAGFLILAFLVKTNMNMSDEELEYYLEEIEVKIAGEETQAKSAMNSALVAIGSRNERLHHLALASARRIGDQKVVKNLSETHF